MIKSCATHLVQFVEPHPSLKELAEDLLAPDLLKNNSIPNWFNYAVAEGILKVAQINVDDKPTAICWYKIDGSKLVIEMIKSISKVCAVGFTWYQCPEITAAFDNLAKRCNCDTIEARTRRKSVLTSLIPLGWIPESINIQRKVS